MKLYYCKAACSLSPHIVLRELDLAVELIPVSLASGRFPGGEIKNLSPKGYIPLLELSDGQILSEGTAILQYLADSKPGSGLLAPVGSLARYRCLEWLNYIATELHKGFSPLFQDALPHEAKVVARENLSKRLQLVQDHLEKNEFLLGASYSVADPYLFTVLNWSSFVGLEMNQWPALLKFMERMKSRPAVNEALLKEGIIKA
jgi:glutathione S-transferase